MQTKKIELPKVLCITLIFLTLLLFIPTITLYRIVEIGGIRESLAIFFFPLVYSVSDALTEIYGQKQATFILFSCYFISLFFSGLLGLSCQLPFPQDFKNPALYTSVFKQAPYVILVGLLSISFSMIVNIKIMYKLKLKMRNRHFIVRSIIASSIGEIIVTCIAYPLLFLSLDKKILLLMSDAYFFKVIYSIFGAFPAKFLVFLFRHIDGEERSEYNQELNNIHYSSV